MNHPPLPTSLLLRLTPEQQRVVQASSAVDPIEVLVIAGRVSRADIERLGGKALLTDAIREYYASFLVPAKLHVAPPEEVAEDLRALAPAAVEAIAQMLSGARKVEKTLLETAKYIVALAAEGALPAAGGKPQTISAEAVPPEWGQVLSLAQRR